MKHAVDGWKTVLDLSFSSAFFFLEGITQTPRGVLFFKPTVVSVAATVCCLSTAIEKFPTPGIHVRHPIVKNTIVVYRMAC